MRPPDLHKHLPIFYILLPKSKKKYVNVRVNVLAQVIDISMQFKECVKVYVNVLGIKKLGRELLCSPHYDGAKPL